MQKPQIGITPEGIPSIGLCALSALVFGALGWWFFALIFLFLTLFCCHFFRDPERVVPTADKVAVSPADGKVIRVTTQKDPITGEDRQYIAIFMNVFSVHVNRSPLKSTVTAITYYPGKFLNAAFDKAATDNERCAYQLQDEDKDTWTMVQISGLIARRIVCRVEEGDKLERGQRYGMIKFGSRVDVYLPPTARPAVSVGDIVFAGQTVIATKE